MAGARRVLRPTKRGRWKAVPAVLSPLRMRLPPRLKFSPDWALKSRAMRLLLARYWRARLAAADDVFAVMRLTEEARGRIEHRTYPAGHMMYVHEPSRLAQSADLASFVRRASGLSA